MKRTKKVSENYLDYVPMHNPEILFEVDEDGKVTILQENKGFFCFLTQKLLKKPKISQIHLDEMGDFIWPLMDGERTVNQIAMEVKEKFGEKAEPLYRRLITYLSTLENYGFLTWKNQKDSQDKEMK